MRKALVFTVIISVATAVCAQEQQITPPPVGSANVYLNVADLNGRLMYLDMGGISGGGFNASAGYGLTDRMGIGGNIGVITMSGDILDGDLTMIMIPFGGNLIYEVFGGNEQNAAGVITVRRPTVSVFGGAQINFMSFTVDTAFFSMSDADIFAFVQAGAVADIPLVDWISIMPYGYVMAGETDMTSFGVDILLRPFKNDPNWQISIGTVLQQVDSNDDDTTMIMVGMSYVAGKHFQRTRIGPVAD